MKKERLAVITISGGADSATSTAWAISQGFEPHFVFFDWGQKTVSRERRCVTLLANHWNVADVLEVSLPFMRNLGAALTDPNAIVHAKNEYVPMRNSIFFAIAGARAEMLRADAVVVGSAGGDHNCPDNRPVFLDAMQKIYEFGTQLKTDIEILAPLRNVPDRIGVIRMGLDLGVPFEHTWSCHNRNDLACGRCSNCEARLEAFGELGLKDPIDYAKI